MIRGLVIAAGAIVALWVALLIAVWIVKPEETSLRAMLRLLPDTLRLTRRIVADRSIPRRTRALVWLLIAYLALPIDLVPDFIPVIGYADDAVITSFVLRHVIHKAGPAKLREHWPGTDDGLATLERILRLPRAS